MNNVLAKRRTTILNAVNVCGMVCVGGLWWFETRKGLITDLDRYGYPALFTIFIVGLITAILSPTYRAYVELGCYFGIALYFIAAIMTFSITQADSNIYIIANTLQWMPVIYIAAFIFFEARQAIVAGIGVFLLSAVSPVVVLATHGAGFWDLSVGALLINAYAVHFMVLLMLSLFIVLHSQLVQASDRATKMESTAHTDQLTGIANRRGLKATLDSYGEMPDRPITLILLDIDHFKRINDRYGHLTGDEVLCSTARLIESQLRKTDLAGRWGGEEFLIIAPGTDLESGMQLAERVRQVVGSSINSTVGPVSISAGIAVWAHGRTLRDALHLADRSLYAAKRQGRNRIETFDLVQAGGTMSNVAGLSRVH